MKIFLAILMVIGSNAFAANHLDKMKGEWELDHAQLTGTVKLSCTTGNRDESENDSMSLKISTNKKVNKLTLKFSAVCDALNLNEQTMNYRVNKKGEIFSGKEKVGEYRDSFIEIYDRRGATLNKIIISLMEKMNSKPKLSFGAMLSAGEDVIFIESILNLSK